MTIPPPRRIRLSTLLSSALIAATAAGADFYVSPTGSDRAAGSPQAPFQTLEAARDAIRALRATAGLPDGGVRVLLTAGVHVLTNTFTLGPEDSGAAGRPVTYGSAPGARATVTSARRIEGWHKVTADPAGLTPAARGNLFVADVPKGWPIRSFFVQGRRQQVARWPDHDRWREWPLYINISHRKIFFARDAPVTNLAPGAADVEMIQLPAQFWNVIVPLRNINAAERTADYATANPIRPAPWVPSFFCLINGLPFLDRPGEWCVDSAAGKIYYWPPDGTMTGKTAEAPLLCELVALRGDLEAGPAVRHVRFKDLAFTLTDRTPEDRWPPHWLKRNSELPQGAISMEGVEDCEVSGCSISDVGGFAITLATRAMRVSITGNEISRTGSGGIYAYGWGPGRLNLNRDNTITRNYIRDVGLAPYWHAAAISLYASSHNRITHNFMENLPYAGISIAECMSKNFAAQRLAGTPLTVPIQSAEFSYEQFRYHEIPAGPFTRASVKPFLHSGDNLIERNIVAEYMTRLADGGALYCWAVGPGNVWRQNVMVRSIDTLIANGIYMDDDTDLALVQSNLCWGPISIAWMDNSHADTGAPGPEMTAGTTPAVAFSGGTSNRWLDNQGSVTNKPAGYDALIADICREVNQMGGWPGNPTPPDKLGRP